MNYHKIDAALANALKSVQELDVADLSVFIRTIDPPAPAEAAQLEKYGVSITDHKRQLFTATLSARAVDELSEQAWVQYIKLSTQLYPTSPP